MIEINKNSTTNRITVSQYTQFLQPVKGNCAAWIWKFITRKKNGCTLLIYGTGFIFPTCPKAHAKHNFSAGEFKLFTAGNLKRLAKNIFPPIFTRFDKLPSEFL